MIKNKLSKLAGIAIIPALLLLACENSFVKDALDSLKKIDIPIQSIVSWSDKTLLIDPVGGSLSGAMTGVLNNTGNSFWFSKTLNNAPLKQWEFKAPTGETTVTADLLAAALKGGTPASDGNNITLTFGTVLDPIPVEGEGFDTPGKTYSFILYPNAFYGKDAGRISQEVATLNFKIEMPTKTNYAVKMIEKYEYGTVSASWAEGTNSSTLYPYLDERDNMKYIAGSLAASAATDVFSTYVSPSLGDTNFQSGAESGGSFSIWNWVSGPDLALTKGHASGKYVLSLDGISYDANGSGPYVSPRISVPVMFTSCVGDAIALIKAAEAAGSFSAVTQSDGGNTLESILGPLIGDLVGGGTTTTWAPAPASGIASTVTIIISGGADGSPGDTVTITATTVPGTPGP